MDLRRVIFFQPRTQARANYSNGDGREQTWTPWFAPLLSPAAKAVGLDVELIDARIDDDWRVRVGELLPGDLLACSVMTGAAIRDSMDASSTARANGASVVWGGPHPTLFPTQTLDQAPVDAIVTGFGFRGFQALISHLMHGPSDLLMATGYRLKTSTSPRHLDRDRVAPRPPHVLQATDPDPDLSIVRDWGKYVNSDEAIADRTVNFVTSEGCLRRCTFCSEPQTSGGAWYQRSIERSVSTIADMVERAQATGLKLHDPNFFDDIPRALAFGKLLHDSTSLPWAASLHPADLIAMSDPELAAASDAGLRRVLVGLETPVPALIKIAGKKYDPMKINSMAARLRDNGIRGMFTFIVGWPGAPATHYDETIAAAHSIHETWPQHQCKIHFLEPWPGTPLFRHLERQGFKYPQTLEEWADIDYYSAQYSSLHDKRYTSIIRDANAVLSPYVNA